MLEPRDLKAFDRTSFKSRTKLPLLLLVFAVGLVGLFAWFFNGYRNQRDRIFGDPKIFDVTVDGAVVSKNNYPDVVDSVVRVPAGKLISVACQSTYKHEEVRFEARFGEELMPAEDCKFTTAAPSVPGQRKTIEISMISRTTAQKFDVETMEFLTTSPEPLVSITHLVDALKNEPIPSEALYVPPEARVVGKVFLPEEPAEAADLRVAILTARADDPLGFVVALDGAEKAKGQIVAIGGVLEPYRRFGDEGRGYYFQSGVPVAFGKKADGNMVIKAIAVVIKKGDLDQLAHRAWTVVKGKAGEESISERGVTLAEAKAMAWKGLISEDLRLVRLAPGQPVPKPVTWRGS